MADDLQTIQPQVAKQVAAASGLAEKSRRCRAPVETTTVPRSVPGDSGTDVRLLEETSHQRLSLNPRRCFDAMDGGEVRQRKER